ncbi:MAG: alanine racemase [Sandaracinaceae bacterium]
MSAKSFTSIETPALLLDRARLERNCAAMRARAERHGVRLRPHLKTAKCVEVAERALSPGSRAITVATLRTARWFAQRGFRDQLLAVSLVPAKVPAVAALLREGVSVRVLVDGPDNAAGVAARAAGLGVVLEAFVEVDCGQGRGGHRPGEAALLEVARVLDASPAMGLLGVLTHAGHSYGAVSHEAREAIAEDERRAAVEAKQRIEAAGVACPEVSVGSTPTVMAARSFEGVTEIRPGVYTFFDATQAALGVCTEDDLALSVLATVVSRGEGYAWIDAGTLALSAERALGAPRYGRVTEVDGAALPGAPVVDGLNQEHGRVVPSEATPLSLEVGAQVRVWPNHACITAAMFDGYHVLVEGAVLERWERLRG